MTPPAFTYRTHQAPRAARGPHHPTHSFSGLGSSALPWFTALQQCRPPSLPRGLGTHSAQDPPPPEPLPATQLQQMPPLQRLSLTRHQTQLLMSAPRNKSRPHQLLPSHAGPKPDLAHWFAPTTEGLLCGSHSGPAWCLAHAPEAGHGHKEQA